MSLDLQQWGGYQCTIHLLSALWNTLSWLYSSLVVHEPQVNTGSAQQSLCFTTWATSGQNCWFLGVISLLMSPNRGINHVRMLLNTADVFTRPFASWSLAALMTEMVICFIARISPPLRRRMKFSVLIVSPDTMTKAEWWLVKTKNLQPDLSRGNIFIMR